MGRKEADELHHGESKVIHSGKNKRWLRKMTGSQLSATVQRRALEHQPRMCCGREGLGDRLGSFLLTLRTR